MSLRSSWALSFLLLAGCGGGGGGESPTPPAANVPAAVPSNPAAPADPLPDAGNPQQAACSASAQRESLRSYMDDQYLFPVRAGEPQAASLDGYFQSLLDKPADRFSYSEPTAAYEQTFILGRRIGYGYTLVWADAARTVLKVRQVEPQGPAARAGLKRGDVIVAIDGQPPARVAAGFPAPVGVPDVPREFRVRDAAGQERVLAARSQEYALTAVPASRTFDVMQGTESVKVGYLAYQQFATYGFIELGDAIRSFGAVGARELVLDLRYNGGGSVNAARDLASMVGGALTAGEMFADLRFNSRHPEQNLSIRYATIPQALPAPPLEGLKRVVVITSAATASASELVINGLRPFMPVVLVGETTFGKPYGFAPRQACGTTFNAVNFEAVNAKGVGGFTAGFAPDCPVADDLDRPLGDPQEARTRAALYYIANGRCESAAPQSAPQAPARHAPVYGETVRPRMFLD